MTRSILVLLFAALLVPVAAPVPAAAAATTPILGVHADRDPSALSAVRGYGQVVGRDIALVNVFKSMEHALANTSEEQEVLDAGHTLMISWRATNGEPNGVPTRAREISNGDHDAYLRTFARGLADLDGRVLVRWHWEMDQDRGSKQYIGTAAEYADAWCRVHDVVSRIAPAVEWVWAPRANSFNKGIGQQYWPSTCAGSVDFVGGSAVPVNKSGSEGSWRGPEDIFSGVAEFARAKSTPLLVWVGVREKVYIEGSDPHDREWANDLAWKGEFIDDLLALMKGPWRDVIGVFVYYHDKNPGLNGNPEGLDFRADSSNRSLARMKVLVCDPVFGTPPASCSSGGGGTGGGTPSTSPDLSKRGVAISGDWDGDGRTDVGWYDRGAVALRTSNGKITRYEYGRAGDVPIVGDFDGDGDDTVSIIRDRVWHINHQLRGGAAASSFIYGRLTAGDLPLAGDWDGDGRDGIGIVRRGEWHLRNAVSGGAAQQQFVYGRVLAGDVPVVGDWRGVGADRVGIVRGTTWHLRYELAGGSADTTLRYGDESNGDVPVVGDWDGDGDSTTGIVRGSRWYLRDDLRGGAATTLLSFQG